MSDSRFFSFFESGRESNGKSQFLRSKCLFAVCKNAKFKANGCLFVISAKEGGQGDARRLK
jgi:hypothetical protein